MWYKKCPVLLDAEIQIMCQIHPAFKLIKLNSGQVGWEGNIDVRKFVHNKIWRVLAIYDHDHPKSRSVKIYPIIPDLEKTKQSIPHTYRDHQGHLFFCTHEPGAVYHNVFNKVTSAANIITRAALWITGYELWQTGTISKENFAKDNWHKTMY